MTKPEMPEALTMFADWLEDHAQGHANEEITADLHEAAELVRVHNKPAELTIKVRIEPAGGYGRQVETTVECSITKRPKFDPEKSIFYVGEGGSLSREDPSYPRLTAIEVPANNDGPAITVDPNTGLVITPGDAADE